MAVEHEKTIYEALRDAAQAYPENRAYSFFGKSTSYTQMLSRIHAAAAGLWHLGIRKSQAVTICMPNSPQAIDCFYALSYLGAVANVIHPLCAPGELQFYLEASQSKAILVLDQFYEKVAALNPQCHILVAGLRRELPLWKRPFYADTKLPKTGYIRWDALCAMGKLPAYTSHDPNLCACILYSGGTTGSPKGVCLSDTNFNAAAMQTLAASGYDTIAGMGMLAVLPIFHGFGLGVGIHTPLIAGGHCILVPRFKLKTYVQLIRKEKPDFLPGVPALFDALVSSQALKGVKLDFLKGIFCGGDSLSPQLKSRVDAFLREHGCTEQLREGYGMTECVSVACLTPRFASQYDTIGLPFPQTAFKIVKPGTTDPVPPEFSGEICISGPSVMLGYLNDPQETASALQIHADGKLWLHTADLGSMNRDGYVRFLSRLKRMIITNGYNVYPAHLEQILLSHPQVKACCVVGVPDAQRGQRVKAFIVPTTAADQPLQESILEHCRQRIARYALPKDWEFRSSLPMTPLNKVDYKQLEEL